MKAFSYSPGKGTLLTYIRLEMLDQNTLPCQLPVFLTKLKSMQLTTKHLF